jgi:3(or 17)beta-hydroxysteroid dehydrogenase
MGRVAGQVALVTGGASGIGLAIVRRLIEEGSRVTMTDLQVSEGEKIAHELGCDFLEHDVTDEKRWAQVVELVEERHGALHILVNNAGISTDNTTADPEHALLRDWQAIQRVNVEGVFLGSRAAIPAIRRSGGGSIVNISSIAALRSNPDNPAYGASKAAVRHLTKSTAVYCARNGSNIRCNSVHPGLILTPLLRRVLKRSATSRQITEEQAREELRALIPTGEFQRPQDIANAVLFLVSDEARQITGAQLVVDGGYTAQ